MRVLVTGCAGFVGSHLTERLCDLGHDVVGIDCFTDYYDRSQKDANLSGLRSQPRFQLIEADLAVADLMYHQAVQPRPRGCVTGRYRLVALPRLEGVNHR